MTASLWMTTSGRGFLRPGLAIMCMTTNQPRCWPWDQARYGRGRVHRHVGDADKQASPDRGSSARLLTFEGSHVVIPRAVQQPVRRPCGSLPGPGHVSPSRLIEHISHYLDADTPCRYT